MAIGTCDICDKHNVPVSHGQDSTGCDVTQCYVCGGDEFDPYCEMDETNVVPFQPHQTEREFQDKAQHCDAEASEYFVKVTKAAKAEFDATMQALRFVSEPRWSRERAVALAKYRVATYAADELCQKTIAELIETGEVSEAMSLAWDALNAAVSVAMSQAAE